MQSRNFICPVVLVLLVLSISYFIFIRQRQPQPPMQTDPMTALKAANANR